MKEVVHEAGACSRGPSQLTWAPWAGQSRVCTHVSSLSLRRGRVAPPRPVVGAEHRSRALCGLSVRPVRAPATAVGDGAGVGPPPRGSGHCFPVRSHGSETGEGWEPGAAAPWTQAGGAGSAPWRQALHPGCPCWVAGVDCWLRRLNKGLWGVPLEEEGTGTPPDLVPSSLPTGRGWSPA